MTRLVLAFSLVATAACGSKKPAPAGPAAGSATTAAPQEGAAEGASCGDGTMGAPNIKCAAGLVCDTGAGTAPTAPEGAQASAKPGTCKKPS